MCYFLGVVTFLNPEIIVRNDYARLSQWGS
jgi:hypothetical protein